MAAFSWRALDQGGKVRKGVMEGDSARQVRNKLRAEAYMPTEVTPIANTTKQKTKGLGGAFRKPLKPRDLALFSTQLAVLLNSGLPLEQALDNVAAQTKKKATANLFKSIRAKVSEGHTLANAMSAFAGSFPDYYIPTVAAGEHSGHLVEVMERLAEYAESSYHAQQKLKMALLYPVIVTFVAFLVIIVLLVYVVPQVVQVFESMQQSLPALTTYLITLSEFLQQHGLILIVLLGVCLLLYRYAMRFQKARHIMHRGLLRTPMIGGFLSRVTAARFVRTCGMLLKSRVPATESLAISGHVVSLIPIKAALREAESRVKEGMPLQRALQATGYFEPLMLNLIASGEASGNLGEMMVHAATVQEKDNNVIVETALGVFEPMMVLLMGAVVLTIVLAILMPIFDMNQLVN
jgi:general secretion pathway protein F